MQVPGKQHKRRRVSWGGSENVGGLQSNERGCFGAGRSCDYDRAGAIEGWIGEISVGSGSGVVFWGDHLALGLQQVGLFDLLVVRPWHHMKDLDEQVSAAITRQPPLEANFQFVVTCGHLTIFDSANPGFEILPPLLRASLEPGGYVVSTRVHNGDNGSRITLHRLEQQR